MRTISIRQPWAWLIVNGFKPIENRDWATSYRGPLLLHAGKTLPRVYYEDVQTQLALLFGVAAPALPAYEELREQAGGIVGQAELVDVVTTSESPWFQGEFGWVLRNPRALPFTPWKGQLGFFDVPRTALRQEAAAC